MKPSTLFYSFNFLLMSDSYKVSHKNAYKKGLKKMQSYLESRGGKYGKTIFFGLQSYLRILAGKVVTKEAIDEAEAFWAQHFGRKDVFNRAAWEYILEKHDGKLPLIIRAVPEGTLIDYKNVLMTIENTDEECAWLVNFTETILMKVWYTITIASQSYKIRQDILEQLVISGSPEGIAFKCHDFAYRGVSSEETAALGAAAHLISFMGTDTVAGIRLLQENYGAGMCGFSIPATEHSIICSFGREGEIEACENFLSEYTEGLIACVSDTYNIYNCCENIWGGVLREKVLARKGTLVIRPDSGDFFEVIPKVLDILWSKFGGTTNAKGYRVLDDHVRVIQGDGMNPETITQLFKHIVALGWSADNLVVGSGGGLLQKTDRDVNKFAIKACAALINDKWVEIYKDPITDSGKTSKRGRQGLTKNIGGGYDSYTINEEALPYLQSPMDELVTVFKNGEILKLYTLDEVKKNAGII
jgi:nicotinamide phosphoribosyltransferase